MNSWQTISPATVYQPPDGQWQIYEKLRVIEKTRGFITIPAFTLIPANLPWKRLVCQYNFSTDNAFSFSRLPIDQIDLSWMIVLSWRRGNIKARFQLWKDKKFGFLVYNNHVIHHNFTVEFWCVNSNIISLAVDLTFFTSFQYEDVNFTGTDITVCSASSLVAQDLLIQLPKVIPFDINPNQRWLDNTGTWNETMASSEKDASIITKGSAA